MEVDRIEALIIAFMGWVSILIGTLIAVQERVLYLEIGGYMVENPYWELGLMLVAAGIALIVFGLSVCAYKILKQKLEQILK